MLAVEYENIPEDIAGPFDPLSRRHTARTWMVTQNHFTAPFPDKLPEKIKGIAGQDEIGANGTPHRHMVIVTAAPVGRNGLMDLLGTRAIWCEPVRNVAAALDYVTKEETRIAGPWRLGTLDFDAAPRFIAFRLHSLLSLR